MRLHAEIHAANCVTFLCGVQIQGAGFAMMGEQMPITLAVTAADPLLEPEVAMKAEYLEGGGHSELQMLLIDSDGTTQPLQVCSVAFPAKQPILCMWG